MQNEKTLLYAEAVEAFKNISLTTRKEKKAIPENYIVATHGPALTKVLQKVSQLYRYISCELFSYW